MTSPVVTHPRVPVRRGAARARTWWGKAWVRAVEEASYSEADLRAARALSRSGSVGQIAVGAGTWVAAVLEGDDSSTVAGTLPVLDDDALDALVETVAAESGRIGALLGGDLPHTLVEHAEEAGVELLPYGSELACTCSCEAWADPCVHALAVLHQLAWLIEADPLVLLHLRGLSRDDLLARLHGRSTGPTTGPITPDPEAADLDLDTAYDAAVRAARVLELLGAPGTDPAIDHLV